MAKKLDIKIRETKDLDADGLVSTRLSRPGPMMARMKSSVKVGRHMRGCGKELGERLLVGGSVAV